MIKELVKDPATLLLPCEAAIAMTPRWRRTCLRRSRRSRTQLPIGEPDRRREIRRGVPQQA